MHAKDYMVFDLPLIFPDTPLHQMAALALQTQGRSLPVVDKRRKYIGVIFKDRLGKTLMGPSSRITAVALMESLPAISEDYVIDGLDFMPNPGSPVVNKNGELVGLWTHASCRTYIKKRYHKVLAFNEAIFDIVGDGIIGIDQNDKVVFLNGVAERLLGISTEQAMGADYSRLVPESELIKIEFDNKKIEKRFRVGNATIVSKRRPVIIDGVFQGAVACFKDISKIESSFGRLQEINDLNRELEGIIESSHDGIVVVDGSGKVLRVSPGYEKMTGMPASRLIGHDTLKLVQDGVISESVSQKVISEQQPVSMVLNVMGSKTLWCFGNPVFEPDTGEIVRIIINCRDITEVLRLRQQLNETTERTERYYTELTKLREKELKVDELIYQSQTMKTLIELTVRVAKVDSTVLIQGESGVGKHLITKLIHKNSSRRRHAFIRVNCGAIPENLLESELFGYQAGAFTGAKKKGKPGLFEVADKGTLFLDEVSELPLKMQVKLLDVLEEQKILRLGAIMPRQINVRIIAATNQDLGKMVADKCFREDLYYRLNVVPISIPPLRQCPEDIKILAKSFLKKYDHKYGFKHRMSSNAYDALKNHVWPGNVRELKNVMERLVVTSPEGLISNVEVFRLLRSEKLTSLAFPVEKSLKDIHSQAERQIISELYRKHRSTRKVGKILGQHQSTIVRKLKRYRIFINDKNP